MSAPTVNLIAAKSITQYTAQITGSVTGSGLSVVTASLVYGLSSAYGTTTMVGYGSGSDVSGSLSGSLTGLVPNTIYHFNITGTYISGSISGSYQGTDTTFTTLAFTPATLGLGKVIIPLKNLRTIHSNLPIGYTTDRDTRIFCGAKVADAKRLAKKTYEDNNPGKTIVDKEQWSVWDDQ